MHRAVTSTLSLLGMCVCEGEREKLGEGDKRNYPNECVQWKPLNGHASTADNHNMTDNSNSPNPFIHFIT